LLRCVYTVIIIVVVEVFINSITLITRRVIGNTDVVIIIATIGLISRYFIFSSVLSYHPFSIGIIFLFPSLPHLLYILIPSTSFFLFSLLPPFFLTSTSIFHLLQPSHLHLILSSLLPPPPYNTRPPM
jgi:hypothetical protein